MRQVRIEDNEFTKQLSGEARKEASINVMCNVLLAKLGGARTVIMFDDAHYMDAASWQLLAAVRQRVHPLLFVLATRPLAKGQEPPELTQIMEEPGGNQPLSELTRQVEGQFFAQRVVPPHLISAHVPCVVDTSLSPSL